MSILRTTFFTKKGIYFIKKSLVALVTSSLFLIACSSPVTGSVKIDKTSYAPNENIVITFQTSNNAPDNAWVGIIPSSVAHGSESENDNNDVAYEYLKKKTSGSITLKAPATAGNFDIRLNDTDNNGKEIATVSFTVTAPVANTTNTPPATLKIEKKTFKPGEKIAVTFATSTLLVDNAWIGVIPSDTPHGKEEVNDGVDLSYQYLSGKQTGTMTFVAPTDPGQYDLRLNDTDSNGKELVSESFTVAQ